MAKATWNGTTIAESDRYEELEGNVYFPVKAVNPAFLHDSSTHTTCPWKGVASYYDVVVSGQVNKDAAWFYPTPSDKAAQIKDHVAFWKGVQVEK
jgi:uncharacterized protein (DUF427 family)